VTEKKKTTRKAGKIIIRKNEVSGGVSVCFHESACKNIFSTDDDE
jgi:hypothetical protein